ncbi:ectoine hydroxylase [Bradyrhizobium cenepequi]|uniref:ectoine hydroxylase n=1 Tax=Bradyrhizobium cenepequi TaxID=2821403 RepID=UPI001CE280D4|nr:ectoine hydroxylase [Bradyrhizobium cenepequi]MCA6107052.1 ectoine hydroxylase [Bradyrhizobium cenepequi]
MTNDFYVSRRSTTPAAIVRQDPVVYSAWSPRSPLTREQAMAYERDGFLALEDLFTAAEVKGLQAEAVRLQTGADKLEGETIITEPGGDTVRSVFKIHKQSNVFQRLATDARLAAIAQFLLGDDVYIHQSRLNLKQGFHGEDFYWHSDFETWHVEDGMPRMRALSMSVLLMENTPVNGPTMFMPGSHKTFVSCVGETPGDHYKHSLKKQEYGVPDQASLSRFAEGGIAMPTGPAGTVVIFDCNTIHGSNTNITPYPRWNAFFVFNAVSNKLQAPFGPAKPRPEIIAARNDVETIRPISGPLFQDAA